MPGFDRNGPMGTGPMTGGRRGLCGRPNVDDGYGYGLERRRGRGRGRCAGYARAGAYSAPRDFGPAHPVSQADEMAMLQAEARVMKASLASVQNRIAELEKEAPD